MTSDNRTTLARFAALTVAALALGSTSAAVSNAASPTTRLGIYCVPKQGSELIRSRPHACTVLAKGASFAEGVNLTSLTWRTWGGSSATATGYELGFHLPYSHVPVAVVAYRPTQCGSSTARVYTRLRVSSELGTSNVHSDGC